jgi:hypothetical protein
MEAPILVPTMLARISVMRDLNRHFEQVFNSDCKGHVNTSKRKRDWVLEATTCR